MIGACMRSDDMQPRFYRAPEACARLKPKTPKRQRFINFNPAAMLGVLQLFSKSCRHMFKILKRLRRDARRRSHGTTPRTADVCLDVEAKTARPCCPCCASFLAASFRLFDLDCFAETLTLDIPIPMPMPMPMPVPPSRHPYP